MQEKTIKITLESARVNAGFTQEEIAKQLKKTKQTIINWEKGRTSVDIPTLYTLSEIYKIPITNIFLPNKST